MLTRLYTVQCVQFDNQAFSTFFLTGQPNKPYDNLDEEEKENIRALLFIMDRFSISQEGYHELTQVENSLPMTYLTESCTKVLDSKWEVTRTLGDAPGAELPSKLLLEHEVRQHVSCTIICFDAQCNAQCNAQMPSVKVFRYKKILFTYKPKHV